MRSLLFLLMLAAFGVHAEVIEAETGKAGPTARIEAVPGASGGKLVRFPGKPVLKIGEIKTDAPELAVPFRVAADGNYEVVLYVFAATGGNDSVYWRVDSGEMRDLRTGSPRKGDPVPAGTVKLAKGDHLIEFYRREMKFGLDKIEIKPAAAKAAKRSLAIGRPLEMQKCPAEFDAARVERHEGGFRLKAGAASNVDDPAAAPDIRFRADFPRDGYYRVHVRALGPRVNAACRIAVPGFPSSRSPMLRAMQHPGTRREAGVFPVRKGEQTIGIVLPAGVTLQEFTFTFDGPRPLPKEIAGYRPPVTPKKVRPRLLLTPERVAELRKTLDHPDLQYALAELRAQAAADVKLEARPGCEVVCQPRLQAKLLANALFSLLNGDRKLARETAKTEHEYFTRLTGFPESNAFYYLRNVIQEAACIYDWCYDAFTPQERKEMIAAFYRLAARQESSWPPLRQSIVNGHGNEVASAFVAFGIACYDEDPEPYRIMAYQIFEQLVPIRKYEMRSPVHPQGVSYGGKCLRSDYFFAAAFRSGCGAEIFGPEAWRVQMYWLMLRLPDTFYFKEGDMWGFTRPPEALTDSLLLAAHLGNDPFLKGAYSVMNCDRDYPLFYLLFHDVALPPIRPADAPMPLAYHFGPYHGSLIARTGWWDDEAAVYCIGGSKHNANHQHSDAGSFQLWYRGFLAADIGEYQTSYGTPYDYNINKRSIAHNMLRVYDPEEKFAQFENDGGSRLVRHIPLTVKDYETNPEYDCGTTWSVSIGPDPLRRSVYSFMASDLTNAYTKKIKNYTRFFVFLNQREADRPASFLTLDLVETAKAEFPKLIQISTFQPPVLKPDFIGLATDRGGRADVNIYLPKKVKITDHANEKASSNPFTGKTYPLPHPASPARLAHRIEIAAAEENAFETFLTHFGVRADGAKALEQAYTELGNAHLVRSGKFLVTLPKRIEFVKTPLVFDVPAGGAQVLCTYLAPGKWHAAGYNFTVKEGENTIFLAAPAGRLEVAPGELAGRPAYRVPKEIEPPAPGSAAGIWIAGKKHADRPVFVNDVALVPADLFPNAPKFTEGRAEVDFNGVTVKLPAAPRAVKGRLYVPAHPLAGMLGMRACCDQYTDQVRFSPLPAHEPGVIEVRTARSADQLHRRIGNPATMVSPGWWSSLNMQAATLVFDRPKTVGAVALTFPSGATSKCRFDFEASMDGRTFHPVASGTAARTDKQFVFRWKPEEMRYLRFHAGKGAIGRVERLDFLP